MKLTRSGVLAVAIAAAFFAGSVVTMAVGGDGAQTAKKKKKKVKRGPQGPAGPAGAAGTAGAPATMPAGAVAFFNLASCPAGWTEMTAAQGRYLVGLPTGGTLAGTAGTALGDLEDRPVGAHTHGVSDPGHSHDFFIPGGTADGDTATNALDEAVQDGGLSHNYISNMFNATTGISIQSTGSQSGTPAPYLQLRVCQKS